MKVYDARAKMGEKLAMKIQSLFGDALDIDSVMPIPETSRTAALQCASMLNLPYREGFVKNRYIARTFIMPGQEVRRKTVRMKLNTIRDEFNNKVVLLVDDSIVRGTTSLELIQMARDAGAKKVYFASAAPPVRYPNVYGIDIPTRYELVAFNRSYDEITEALGADRVIYNDLQDVVDSVRAFNPDVLNDFEDSCFSGKYVTDEITEVYLAALEEKRGDRKVHSASPFVVLPSTAAGKETVNVNGNGNTNSNCHNNGHANGKLLAPAPKNAWSTLPLAAEREESGRSSSSGGGGIAMPTNDEENDNSIIAAPSPTRPTKRHTSNGSACEPIFNN